MAELASQGQTRIIWERLAGEPTPFNPMGHGVADDGSIFLGGVGDDAFYGPATVQKWSPAGELQWEIVRDEIYSAGRFAVGGGVMALGESGAQVQEVVALDLQGDLLWVDTAGLIPLHDENSIADLVIGRNGDVAVTRNYCDYNGGDPLDPFYCGNEGYIHPADGSPIWGTHPGFYKAFDADGSVYSVSSEHELEIAGRLHFSEAPGTLIWNVPFDWSNPSSIRGISVNAQSIILWGYELDAQGWLPWLRLLDAQGQEVMFMTFDSCRQLFLVDAYVNDAGIIYGAGSLPTENSGRQAWIVAWDASGNHIWSQLWGGKGDDGAGRIEPSVFDESLVAAMYEVQDDLPSIQSIAKVSVTAP